MDKKLDFADLLIKYMARSKMGARDLAAKIGVTERMIRDYRAGVSKPRCNKAVKMAEVLGLTPWEMEIFLKAINYECFENQFPNTFAHEIDKWAAAIFPEFTEKLLSQLATLRPPVVLLLNQAGWDSPPCREALLIQAKKRYAAENVFSIFPAAHAKNADDYFTNLAEQCNFNDVADCVDFERSLKQHLKNGKNIFLLVSRFEKIKDTELQRQFAGIVRSCSEEFKNMHVILCGGQQLENLKFQGGALSLLNCAELKHWPELGKTEVKALRDHAFKAIPPLTDSEAAEILKISGGHPQLLYASLEVKQNQPKLVFSEYDHDDSLIKSVWQAFTSYRENKADREQILVWLEKEEIGGNSPFILNDLLRELYWKNLLTRRNNRLCWRCEVIRVAGKMILK